VSTVAARRDRRERRDPRPGRAAWREVLGALPWAVRSQLSRQDLLLHGAAVTFYAAIAGVPMLMLAVRLATLVVGEERVRYLATTLEAALPRGSGAGPVARTVIEQAAATSWFVALFAAFAASLYGEGLRRAYGSLDRVKESRTGWRGRVAVLPVLAAAPLLLLAVLGITPMLATLFSEGRPAATALGVYVALNVDWIAVSVPLAWSFRVVAPDPPSWRLALVGGFATGAFISGFLQGFTLFLWLPIDLGAPFGGNQAVGGWTAVLLWVWLLHLVALLGYVATQQAGRLLATRREVAELERRGEPVA
jgi:membrane protein